MNVDNFVVRPHRRWVETYAELDAWTHLKPPAIHEIDEHLTGLPSSLVDSDELAKRFDLLLLRLQLGALNNEPGAERLRRQVQDIATALLAQSTIPAIQAQAVFLEEIAGDVWWVDVTLPMLELLRRRIRGLVALIERSRRAIVYTDFADELGEQTEIRMKAIQTGIDRQRFDEKARAYLRAHLDHLAIQKLYRNLPLTADDLADLERILLASGAGDSGDVQDARRRARGLGPFIRSLVGLDRAAANALFSEFLNASTYTADQIHFVNEIVNQLTEAGVMEPGRLYESPFTDSAPTGPDELFETADVERIISILRSVNSTAGSEATVA